MTSKPGECLLCHQPLGTNYAHCSNCLYAQNVAAAWNSGQQAIAKVAPDGNSITVAGETFEGELVRFNVPDAQGNVIRPDSIRPPRDGADVIMGVDPGAPGADHTAQVIMQRDDAGFVHVISDNVHGVYDMEDPRIYTRIGHIREVRPWHRRLWSWLRGF